MGRVSPYNSVIFFVALVMAAASGVRAETLATSRTHSSQTFGERALIRFVWDAIPGMPPVEVDLPAFGPGTLVSSAAA